MIADRRSRLRATAFASLLVFSTLFGLSRLARIRTDGPAPASAAPAQQGRDWILPNLQTRGFGFDRQGGARPAGPHGMVGFGYSTIELLNRDLGPNTASIQIESFERSVKLQRSLTARGALELPLRREQQVGLGSHIAKVSSAGLLGVTARSEWPEGGSAFLYGAPERGTNLILPLTARAVYSLSSNIHIANASDSDDNRVEMTMFKDDGSIAQAITFRLRGFESTEYDLTFDAQFAELPINSGGGHLNAIHFDADEPIVAMAYGDGLFPNAGTSAYRARPAGLAAGEQLLPLVRSNYLGDSLIGIANAHNQAVNVSISYLGAPDSPSGAGQRFEQSFQIGVRGAAFVDLSSRGRGTRPSPSLPRGSGANRGFYGSATISASGKVLAAVEDAAFAGTVSQTSAAYNAFSPEDLATAWALPGLGRGVDGRKQHAVVQAPGGAAAKITIAYLDTAGKRSEGQAVEIPGGATRLIAASPPNIQLSQILVESDIPVAVLDLDTPYHNSTEWGRWGRDAMVEWAIPVPGGGGGIQLTPTPTALPPTSTATDLPPTATDLPPTATATASTTPVIEGGLIYLPRCFLAQ